MPSGAAAADNAAGDLPAGIPGWLGGEIIRIFVDDDRTVEDIFDLETFVIKSAPGVALVAKEREQIAGMPGMGIAVRIVVAACLGEVLGTVTMFMDMKGIETGPSGDRDVGQIEYFRFNQDSAIGRGIEFDQAADLRIIRAALEPGKDRKSVV